MLSFVGPFAIAFTLSACDLVFTLNDDTPEFANANRVFVTSTLHRGDFGGIAGGDQICATAATSADLDGEFVAWLSVAGPMPVDAIERITGSRGWIRLDGVPVADRPSDLGVRGPLVPISVTEIGDDIRGQNDRVWTGSSANGTRNDGSTCLDWTSIEMNAFGRRGDPSAGVGAWGSFEDVQCALSNRLYCFEVGKDVEIVLPPPRDPVMFVSAQTWAPDAGIAAADELCNKEASAAGLAGTFLAALSSAGQALTGRFAQHHSYVRVDGVRIGSVLTDVTHDTFCHLTASNTPVEALTWTGGPPNQVGTGTCTDWSGIGSGDAGSSAHSTARMFVSFADLACTDALRIFCLQE